ncbi:MAG: NADH-quinone oxidoreductase subunit C [Chloroflexota bacterium]
MALNVRRRPPAPPAPRYLRAAAVIEEKAKQYLVGPLEIAPDCLKLEVDAEGLRALAQLLRDDPELGFNYLSCVSGVDMKDHMQVVYHLHALARVLTVQLRVRLDRDNPVVDSVVPVWPTANWLERETYDLLGIEFSGHPDPRRIFLDDDFVGHPLRRDFLAPAYRQEGVAR